MSAARNPTLLLAGVLVLLSLAGCAGFSRFEARHLASELPLRDCAEWYGAIDSAVDAAGVRDGQSARVNGFPYLRVDRFSASLAEMARSRESAMHALVERLVALDLEARTHELVNLPPARLKAAGSGFGAPDLASSIDQTRRCGRLLSRSDLETPDVRNALLQNLRVPDDYLTAYRVAGLYWLSRIPFREGVERHMDDTRVAFERDLESTAQGTVVRYSPVSRPRTTAEQVRRILERSADNSLQVPEPAGEELDLLFRLYAPSFEVETTGDFDRPGALRWRWGSVPEVDSADPAVYRQVAHTRYQGTNLLQLVYTLWFPERPAQTPNDLLSGLLDGVVFRVTLAPDGTPLLYDTMHACGCYHMFFTTPRAVPRPAPEGEREWAFLPQKLRSLRPDDRVVLRIATRTHYVDRVYRDQDDSLTRYELRPYGDLRSMRRMPGGAQSVFGPDGVIAGTERAERFLFWPMGIANAGAMRQWGRHATAFIGRRHFDDADLLERRFVLDLK
jgi:hypothetical protein